MSGVARIGLLAALLLAAGCHDKHAAPGVTRAWVRLPAVAGQPGAAYFTVEGGRAATRLTRIESALVLHIEMHESISGMGMATMKPLAGVDVPAGASVVFAPGGRHAMLFGIEAAVKPGTAIPLRFGFADGTTAEAEAKTVAAAGDAPY
jgi:copper(I)-binding protein